MVQSRTRWASVLLQLVLLLMIGLVSAVGSLTTAAAQEATPAAAEGEEFLPEGVSFEFLGYGPGIALPANPADVVLLRLTLEPGASFPLDPNDPSIGLVAIESGALAFVMDEPITVLHPVVDGFPGPDDFETVPAGEEFTLEEGASAVFPPNIGGEFRNDGEEAVSLLVALIAPPEAGEGATPVAGTPEG